MDFTNKRIRAQFDKKISELTESFRSFPWHDQRAYANWLAQSHYLVCHTTTFLSLVAAKLGPEPSQRHRDVLKHLREETGHEQLPLNDIKALGLDFAAFPELLETAVIYQSQYYWLDRGGPIAHVGYSLMLEGFAVTEGKALSDTLQRLHGKQAASFIRVHAEDDVGHFAEGMKRLNGATTRDIELALKNLSQSCRLYRSMLEAIQKASASSRSVEKAAA